MNRNWFSWAVGVGVLLGVLYGLRAFFHIVEAVNGGAMPVDQALQYWNLNHLLAGRNYLDLHVHTSYPPSYLLLLYPFLGWKYTTSIILWACANVSIIALVVALSSRGHWGVMGVLIGCQAFWQTVGVGQFGLLPLLGAMLLAGAFPQVRPSLHMIPGLVAALLLAGKPSLSIPLLLWMLLQRGLRWQVVAAGALHGVLLLVAATMLAIPVEAMLGQWITNQSLTGQEALGKLDLFRLLYAAGLPSGWISLAAVALSLAVAVGVKRWISTPEVAISLLLIAARLLFYHAPYDNLMLVPAAGFLLYFGYKNNNITGSIAGLATAISVWIPARLLELPHGAGLFLVGLQALIWLYAAYRLVVIDGGAGARRSALPQEIPQEILRTAGP